MVHENEQTNYFVPHGTVQLFQVLIIENSSQVIHYIYFIFGDIFWKRIVKFLLKTLVFQKNELNINVDCILHKLLTEYLDKQTN